jgi:F0F1-type ATP synthase alpha subunit
MRKGFVIIISNKMNKLDCSFNHLGIVEAIGDGIGLTNVANGDMIRFCISEKKQEEGLVLNLEKNKIVLSSDEKIKPGQFVIRTFQLMSLQSINTNASALIIGDSKTEIALGN